MCDLIISAHEISDLLKYNKRNVVDDIISNARKTILAGYKAIIRETYENSPHQDLKTFTTIGEIDAWVEDLDLLDDINSIKR